MAEPIASRPAAPDSGERRRLRRAVCRALEQAQPDLRVLAEAVLAEASAIDLLAVGADGELIAIRIAEPGDDLAMLTRLLADLSWLRPRREDLLKFASGHGIDPSAEPRGWLVAASIGRETRAAVDNFPAETIELWLGRPGGDGDRFTLRLERVEPAAPPLPVSPSGGAALVPGASRGARADESDRSDRPLTDPPSPSAFRTGLCEADLEPPASPADRNRSR